MNALRVFLAGVVLGGGWLAALDGAVTAVERRPLPLEWDGRWNGDFVPVGTYYYHIYLREVEYKLTGSLNVIR